MARIEEWHECRYGDIRKQQAAKLKENHERSLQMLKSQQRTFSFYGKALAKTEAAKQYKPPTAKDFQRPFKANPIPKSSLEVSSIQPNQNLPAEQHSFARDTNNAC